MTIYSLIVKRRTIRKFKQKKVGRGILLDCLRSARLAPSSANLQPLEYIVVTKDLERVFKHTRWAGYLKDGVPAENEKPVAYIIIISNSEINKDARYDVGLAAENIILTALGRGVASCIIGCLGREQLKTDLQIPEIYAVELAIALGYPKQRSVIANFKGDVKYWLKGNSLHVPKKCLSAIVRDNHF